MGKSKSDDAPAPGDNPQVSKDEVKEEDDGEPMVQELLNRNIGFNFCMIELSFRCWISTMLRTPTCRGVTRNLIT